MDFVLAVLASCLGRILFQITMVVCDSIKEWLVKK